MQLAVDKEIKRRIEMKRCNASIIHYRTVRFVIIPVIYMKRIEITHNVSHPKVRHRTTCLVMPETELIDWVMLLTS